MGLTEEAADRRMGLATHDIAAAVGHLYGWGVAELRRLGGEYDQTFALSTDGGLRAVVKVYRANEVGGVRWQHQLLDRLAGLVPVPAVLRGRDGADVVLLDDDLCLSVYSWIDGSLLSDLPEHPSELVIDWGRTAGNIVAGLAGMQENRQEARTHGGDL